MNIGRLRFQIILRRAVGVAFALEALLLLPRVAWAATPAVKTERVKKCSPDCSYFLKITDTSNGLSCLLPHTPDPKMDKSLIPVAFGRFPPCSTSQVLTYNAALKAGKVTPVDAPIPLKEVTVTGKKDKKESQQSSNAGKRSSGSKSGKTTAKNSSSGSPAQSNAPKSDSSKEDGPVAVGDPGHSYEYNEKTGLWDKYNDATGERVGTAKYRKDSYGNNRFYDVAERDHSADQEINVGNGQYITVDKYGNRSLRMDPNYKANAEARKAEQKRMAEEAAKSKEKGADPCFQSAMFADSQNLSPEERARFANLKCKGAVRDAKKAEIANMVSQAGGQAMIQSMGQRGVNAASQSGSISETHVQAAKLSKSAAKIQGVLGAANLYMTSKMAKHATNHKRNVAELQQAAGANYILDPKSFENGQKVIRSDDSVQDALIKHHNLNEKMDYASDVDKVGLVRDRALKENERLLNEQMDAFNRSHQSKEATQQEAAKQLANMAASSFAAIQAAKTAKLARKTEANANNPVLPNFGVDPAELKRQQEQQNGIPDPTSGDSSATSDDTIDTISTNTDPSQGDYALGDGAGDPGAPNGPKGPTPGGFNAATGGGSAGGGGGGLGGGIGGNAPPAPNQEESRPQYAGNFGGKDSYEGTGSMTRGVGGGNKGGAGGDGGGIDFNSLLAKFLPSEEEAQSPSVLETEFGGNRGIATVNSAPSLLDAKADLFGRVHDLYQQKHSRGQIGNR